MRVEEWPNPETQISESDAEDFSGIYHSDLFASRRHISIFSVNNIIRKISLVLNVSVVRIGEMYVQLILSIVIPTYIYLIIYLP